MKRRQNGLDGESFTPMFPGPTAGDAVVRANNLRSGREQPDARPSPRRKLRCRQCGFMCDLSRQVPSGGDLTGDGAIRISVEEISGATASVPTETVGVSSVSKGAGCPFCGSRNFAAATARAA